MFYSPGFWSTHVLLTLLFNKHHSSQQQISVQMILLQIFQLASKLHHDCEDENIAGIYCDLIHNCNIYRNIYNSIKPGSRQNNRERSETNILPPRFKCLENNCMCFSATRWTGVSLQWTSNPRLDPSVMSQATLCPNMLHSSSFFIANKKHYNVYTFLLFCNRKTHKKIFRIVCQSLK